MLSVPFGYYYVKKRQSNKLFGIIKQVLRYGRKAFLYTYCVLRIYSAYESNLYCGNIGISIGRSNDVDVFYTDLWNVQNCQVCILYI